MGRLIGYKSFMLMQIEDNARVNIYFGPRQICRKIEFLSISERVGILLRYWDKNLTGHCIIFHSLYFDPFRYRTVPVRTV